MAIALHYTDAQRAFRAEVRAWMAANVPREPLETLESARGFAAHREWERTLARGRWGMVTWPEEYGGRGCDLIEWLIFEEEYYRAQAPARANQNGIFLLGPTLMEFGTPEQKARFLPTDGGGRGDVGAGLVRAAGGLGSRGTARHCSARRRRVRAARSQDLVLARGLRGLGLRHVPHRPGVGAASRHLVHPVSTRPARCARTRHPADPRRDGFRRDLLRGCARPGCKPARRRGRGLADRDGDRRLRARTDAAQPRPLPGDGGAPRRALPSACRGARPGDRQTGRAGMDGRAGVRAQHLHDRLAPDRRRHDRRGGQPQQDLLVGARSRDARLRDAHPRVRARSCCRRRPTPGTSAPGSRATCSRSQARSMPARTRSSATSSRSG